TELQVTTTPTCVWLVKTKPASPSPSSPFQFTPQHHSVPVVRTAQVLNWPAPSLLQLVAAPTCTGLSRSVWSARPNCPALFRPQHHSVPAVRATQVWSAPRA